MILLSALLLAAQPATAPRKAVRARRPAAVATVRPTSDWLKGLWIAEGQQGQEMEGCADWSAVFYQADGHYLHGDVTGRWSLQGDKLQLQQTTFIEGGGDEGAEVGDAVTNRVVRLGKDRLKLVGPDQKATLYLRCPKPETPVAR